MEIRVAHGLAREVAVERLREAMRKADLDESLDDEGGYGGTVLKATPLGSVEGSWRVEIEEVVVTVWKKPAWLPEATIRGPLEQGLRDALKRG